MNNIEKFNSIMQRYRDGEFGNGHLTLYDILEKAGEKDFFNQLTFEELQELYNSSKGSMRNIISVAIDKRLEKYFKTLDKVLKV